MHTEKQRGLSSLADAMPHIPVAFRQFCRLDPACQHENVPVVFLMFLDI